jgi:hypothetical protein
MKARKYKKEKVQVPEFKFKQPLEIGSVEYKENVLRKWKPICEILNVTDEKLINFMCEYAEYHMLLENVAFTTTGPMGPIKEISTPNMSDIFKNLLPISLKVLSKLNLKNKNVMILDNQPTMKFNYTLKSGDVDVAEKINLEIIAMVEDILIQKLVDYLNKELETKDNLYITMLVNSVSLISEKTMLPTMILSTRCQVK